MKLLFLLPLVVILLTGSIQAQGTSDFWILYSPELRYFLNDKKVEVRFRPHDYLSPFKSHRTELAAGRRFFGGKFNVYSQSRIDGGTESFVRPRVWTGTRLNGVQNFKIFNTKITMSEQYRFLKGMNKYSNDMHILVQENYVWLTPKIAASTMFFGVYSRGSSGLPNLWFGPSLFVTYNKRFVSLFVLMKDLSQQNDKMLLLRIQLKLF